LRNWFSRLGSNGAPADPDDPVEAGLVAFAVSER